MRVSAVGGREGESFRSPDDQAAAIRAWAKARGHSVEVLPPELDESGGRDDRPILMQAIEAIGAGRFDGLVAFDQSRIMRQTAYLLVLVDQIQQMGGEVSVVDGDVDWDTPEGRMFGTFRAAIDEHQRRDKARMFERLRKSSAEKGVWKFRQVPIGYMLAGERPCGLVPSLDAPKVKAAFAARLRGESMLSVAEHLEMTASGARAVLRNRVYLGEIHIGPHVNRESHEPIVDAATFEGVQALRQVRPAKGAGPISLLAGLARCAGCGHIMAKNMNQRGGVYVCKFDHSAGRCPDRSAISAPGIERYVAEAARAELEALKINTARRSEGADKLRDDLARAQTELAAFLSATSAAGLPIESFASGARERQDAIDTAQAALDQYQTLTPLGGLFDTGADLWDDLEAHERNQLLRGLIAAVVIRSVGRGAKTPVSHRVRLFAHGTLGDLTYRGGGKPMPVAAMPFPDADDERLLGVTGRKNRFGGSSG